MTDPGDTPIVRWEVEKAAHGTRMRVVPTVAVHHLPQACGTHPWGVQVGGVFAGWFAQEHWARGFAAEQERIVRSTGKDAASAAEDMLRGPQP